jgi:YT521-B-like domain
MIKSWNYENVEAAQRESIWATQPHNEELLAEAFKSSRHVILLFSVNKSTAFQGYVCVTFRSLLGFLKHVHLKRKRSCLCVNFEAFAVPLRLFIYHFYNYQITSTILISCISIYFLLRIRTHTYRPLK